VSARPEQLAALSEILNIGVGSAAELLCEMLRSRVLLQVPEVRLLQLEELHRDFPELAAPRLAAVEMPFRGLLSGTSALLFPAHSAAELVNALTPDGDPSDDLDAIRAATLTEVGNIVLNGVMGAMANTLSTRFSYTLPTFAERTVAELWRADAEQSVLLARTRFRVESTEIEGDVLVLLEVGCLDEMLRAVDRLLAGSA
jgi:chemotaxis protein CheC